MVPQVNILKLEGWVQDSHSRFVISPGGDVVLMPLIVIYADQFWDKHGNSLPLPAQPIELEFNQTMARQDTVWTLGERLQATGEVVALNVTRAKQQPAIRQVRERIATVDRNRLLSFATGHYLMAKHIMRVAQLREQYLAGEIGLDTLQNEENRIFAHDGSVWLKLLARMHDKQLAIRRDALPKLLEGSRTAYVIRNPTNVQRSVLTRARIKTPKARDQDPRRPGSQVLFYATSREPKVDKSQTLTAAGRAEQLEPLHRFRESWLRAGQPAKVLPTPPSYLSEKQKQWLLYEERSKVKW